MALTADKVVVELQADIDGFNRNTRLAEKEFKQLTSEIVRGAGGAESAIGVLGRDAQVLAGRVATAQAQAAAQAATAKVAAIRATESYTKAELDAAIAAQRSSAATLAAARAETSRLSALAAEENALERVASSARDANTAIATGAPRAKVAIDSVTGSVGNMGAQFQDIGVQLAGGQSPLLIALQQGTQLSAVIGQTANPVRALGAAFASIVSPVSLATIGIIALGGYAIQYFSTLLNDGSQSAEVIKEQNDLIRKVAENWGEAVPALRAYVDELNRAAEQEEIGGAYDAQVKRQFEGLREQLGPLRTELGTVIDILDEMGASDEDIGKLQDAFNLLAERVQNGTATAEDLDRVLNLLAGTTGGATIPAMVNFQGVLGGVAQALAIASAEAATLRREQALLAASAPDDGDAYRDRQVATFQFTREQERLNGLTTEQLGLEREISRVRAEAERDGATLTDAEALSVAQERLGAEKRRADIIKAGKADASTGKKAQTEAEREREAVLDLIATLEFENEMVGASAQEKAVQTALRRAGAAATDEERQKIEELINATYGEQEALKMAEDAARAFSQAGESVVKGFISDLRKGETAAEAFSNVLDNIADQLINMAISQAFNPKGGFNIGSLFSGGGPAAPDAPGFASGTANTGGSRGQARGIVHGQEAVIPLPGGGKVPVELAEQRGGGGSVVINQTLSFAGAVSEEAVQRMASQAALATSSQTYDAVKKSLPGWQVQLRQNGRLS